MVVAIAAVVMSLGWMVPAAHAGDDWDVGHLESQKKQGQCAVEPPWFRKLGRPGVLRTCGDVTRRQWQFKTLTKTKSGHHIVQIRNRFSGYCLAPAKKGNGAVVRNTYCVHPTGGRARSTKWKVVGITQFGHTTFVNRWSKKCLSFKVPNARGRRLAHHWCDPGKAKQLWTGAWRAVAH